MRTAVVDDHLPIDQNLAVLTEASVALTEAGLDTPVVLDTFTDLLVEHVGDSAIAYVIAVNGVDFEVGAVTSKNPAVVPLIQRMESKPPYRVDDDSLVARCARERRPLIFPTVDLGSLQPALPVDYQAVFETSPVRSLVYVPLATRTEVLGVLAVTRILGEREPFDDAEVELTCDLAELATRALTNTRLHRDLAGSTALFETAFKSAPIGMALVSITGDVGRLLRVNASMTELTGYTEEELLAMRVPDLFGPGVRDRIEEDLHEATAGTPADARELGRLVHRDGTEIEARVHARLVSVPGRPAHIGLMQVQPLDRE